MKPDKLLASTCIKELMKLPNCNGNKNCSELFGAQ